MNLQNVTAAIYLKAADAIAAGKYKLVYEKNGRIYGSKSGIPSTEDFCFNKPSKTTKATTKLEAKKVVEVKEPVFEKLAKDEMPEANIAAKQSVEIKEEQASEVHE